MPDPIEPGAGSQIGNTYVTNAPKLWVVLARAYGSIAAYLEQRIATEGLCLSDFMVLEVLLHKGPLTMSAIGAKVLLANASMTSAIDRLDERGFVTRNNNKADRRVRIVELTPAGRQFIAAIYARHERDIEAVMAGVSEAERAQLRQGLKTIGMAAQAASRSNSKIDEGNRKGSRVPPPVRIKRTTKEGASQ